MTRRLLILLVLALTAGVSRAQTTAIAQAGEGIFRLLKRTGQEASNAKVVEFRELNKDKLTRTGDLMKGVSYRLPSSGPRVINQPLFGEKYRYVEVIDDTMKDWVVYMVSGHGGDDTGTRVKVNGKWINEDEYAYDVMLRFGKNAMAHGATVYFMTQDDDGIRDGEYLPGDRDERHLDGKIVRGKRGRLYGRTDRINALYKKHRGKKQVVIEFHIDSYQDASKSFDVGFLYWSAESERLARSMNATMAEMYKKYRPNRAYNGRLNKRKLHTPRHAIPVVAYIELANIKNASDQKRIILPSNRQYLADWTFEALRRYTSK